MTSDFTRTMLALYMICSNVTVSASLKIDDYLFKPTGYYASGFQDFHWINLNNCPDFNYTGKNNDDFSPNNVKHCHEIMARIYYPTVDKFTFITSYYSPAIRNMQEGLQQNPNISKKKIDELNQLKSFSIEKANIVKNKKFPVLLFSPGSGCPAEIYENLITGLVSHGYIVIGINTPFLNTVALPDGHVVQPANVSTRKEGAIKFIPLQMQDLSYTFQQLSVLHDSNSIFSAMDLKHIGVFGHSMGGKTVAKTVESHPDWFQAAVTLDMASYEANDQAEKSPIPIMHFISAYWESFFNWPLIFELGKNSFLVLLSPSIQDQHYSYHMNYTDLSTLQVLPVWKSALSLMKTKQRTGIDVKMMSYTPSVQGHTTFNSPTYILIKKNITWRLYYSEHGEKAEKVDLDVVGGIETALFNLPKKIPEQLTMAEIKPIQKALTAYHQGFGSFLGTGNGREITKAINTYLLQFFDTFLKGRRNQTLKDCKSLSRNTHIRCGGINTISIYSRDNI